MKNRIIFVFLLLTSQLLGQVPEYGDAVFYTTGWPYNTGGFAVDGFGNTYTCMSNAVFSNSTETGVFFKHNREGQLIWAKNQLWFSQIVIDEMNNIYASGYHSTGALPDSLNPNQENENTYFVCKLSQDGNPEWIVRTPYRTSITPTEDGNVAFAVSLDHQYSTDWLDSEDLSPLTFGLNDYYIYGLISSSGTLIWREISSQPIDVPSGFQLIKGIKYNNGKLYFYGAFNDNITMGTTNVSSPNMWSGNNWPYPMHEYLAEVNLYSHQITDVITTAFLNIQGVSFDDQDRIYLALQHYKSGSVGGDGLIQNHTINQPPNADAYVVRLNNNLSFDTIHNICGVSESNSAPIFINDIEVKDNRVYVLGSIHPNGSLAYLNPNGPNLAGSSLNYLLVR